MGFNDATHKFDYYTGSGWISLEYIANSCSGNSATATTSDFAKYDYAEKSKSAANRVEIKDKYTLVSQVQTYAANKGDKNKIVKFNGERIQFPNGAQFWVN